MIKVLSSSPSIAGSVRSEEGEAISPSPYSAEAGGLVRSPMNWRRGCFRLWIVGSALYVIAVAAITSSEIKSKFENLDRSDWVRLGERLVPARCSEARGAMGKDFSLRMETPDTCWYELPNFRLRYPEHNDLSDRDLVTKLYTAVGKPLPPAHPWATLLNWIGIAVGIPLLVLILGAAMGWAFSGFKASTSPASRRLYRGA